MPRVMYTREQQGFRPYTNPSKALAGISGLGDVYDPVSGEYVPGLPSVDNPVAGARPWSENQADPYGVIQQGSFGIFQAAWPWLAVLGSLMFIRNLGGRRK